MINHPNRSKLYTVLNQHGEPQSRGCSVEEAAIEVMQYDSNEFEIRQEDDGEGFRLWTSTSPNFRQHGRIVLSKSVIFSLATDRRQAEADIYRQVIRNAEWWKGCEVISDETFDERLREIERDLEEGE